MEKRSYLETEYSQLIFHHISDLIFLIRTVDEHCYEIEAMNDAFLANYHTTMEEISGKRIEEFLCEEQCIKAFRRFREVIKSKRTLHFEEEYTFEEQGYRLFDITLVPIIEDNTVCKLIGTAKDITEKRACEDQLAQAEKLSVVGQLAAGVAHELKNPLTSLKGFLKLIKFRNKDHDIKRYIEVMENEFCRLQLIIEEFLILAKPSKLTFNTHRLENIIDEVIELLNAQANMNSIVLTTEYSDSLPPLYCENNQLKQVFINIIKNAIEASDGGDKISVRIDFFDKHFHISIKDNGKGIAQEEIEKLGSPFYTTKKNGTGLGLAICKRIIEKHKGKLRVKSTIGYGTEITVTLPPSASQTQRAQKNNSRY